MKATILQEDLNRGLVTVSRVVASRGQLPILANVLVEASREGLIVSATNLELGMRVMVGGKVSEEGSVTVPAKNFGEFVNSLIGGPIDLNSDGVNLKVKSGKFGANFAGISATEFPAFAKATATKDSEIQIKRTIVSEIATQIAYAAAGDESRPVLTGVKLGVVGSEMTVTATDGFRLARKGFKVEGLMSNIDGLILPARTILELARIIEGETKEEVKLEVVKENNQVIFTYDKTELISRVLEGNFPEVDKIIPKDFKTEVTLDREELARAIKAVGVFARENNNIIRFKVEDLMFKVSAAAKESGEGEVEIEADDKTGEDGEIAFNFRYVVDFLNSLVGEKVIFKMSGNLAPGVWGEEKNRELVALIMPVRV